jgi:hypothetical protein
MIKGILQIDMSAMRLNRNQRVHPFACNVFVWALLILFILAGGFLASDLAGGSACVYCSFQVW